MRISMLALLLFVVTPVVAQLDDRTWLYSVQDESITSRETRMAYTDVRTDDPSGLTQLGITRKFTEATPTIYLSLIHYARDWQSAEVLIGDREIECEIGFNETNLTVYLTACEGTMAGLLDLMMSMPRMIIVLKRDSSHLAGGAQRDYHVELAGSRAAISRVLAAGAQ